MNFCSRGLIRIDQGDLKAVQEGQLTHDEINHSLAAAAKTIIFARQNRLRDGVMLPDQTLRRFHAGHDWRGGP